MKNVLLIGSGNRMKFGIIPALWCLHDSVSIAAVYSRAQKELSLLGGELRIQTTTSISGIDFKDVDCIIVAVSTGEVAGVLKKLSSYSTKHITLLLDTPVLSAYHLLATRFFKNFKGVCVTEDSIALPPFVLAKKLVDEGAIGRVRHIHFSHNAFRYHALAALRLFLGEPRSIVAKKNQKLFRFKIGTATLDEPMTPDGTFLIEGERGSIADYDHPGARRIKYTRENGLYRGLLLDGKEIAQTPHEKLYSAIDSRVFDDAPETIRAFSFQNSMKIRALIDLIPSALAGGQMTYPPESALFDALSITIAEQFGRFESRYIPLSPLLHFLIRH